MEDDQLFNPWLSTRIPGTGWGICAGVTRVIKSISTALGTFKQDSGCHSKEDLTGAHTIKVDKKKSQRGGSQWQYFKRFHYQADEDATSGDGNNCLVSISLHEGCDKYFTDFRENWVLTGNQTGVRISFSHLSTDSDISQPIFYLSSWSVIQPFTLP